MDLRKGNKLYALARSGWVVKHMRDMYVTLHVLEAFLKISKHFSTYIL